MKRSYSRIDLRKNVKENTEKQVHWVWISFLSIWTVLLSGILSDIAGTPGLIQSLKLRSLLQTRQNDLTSLDAQMVRMDADRHRLEENSVVQEREIRRVLGYASKNEIIFDFSTYTAKR